MRNLTKRDFEVIELVKSLKVARTSTIATMFPSLSACQKRLKVIAETNSLKRMKDLESGEYIYFQRKPKFLKHSLILSDFYREMSNVAKIEKFIPEYVVDDLRADAFMGYMFGGKRYAAFVEVEISNKGFDILKYEKCYRSGKYSVFPKIVAITDKPIRDTFLHVEKIDTHFCTIKKLYHKNDWYS